MTAGFSLFPCQRFPFRFWAAWLVLALCLLAPVTHLAQVPVPATAAGLALPGAEEDLTATLGASRSVLQPLVLGLPRLTPLGLASRPAAPPEPAAPPAPAASGPRLALASSPCSPRPPPA